MIGLFQGASQAHSLANSPEVAHCRDIEHGPCQVNPDGETTVLNPYSWNNLSNSASSVLLIAWFSSNLSESPVGDVVRTLAHPSLSPLLAAGTTGMNMTLESAIVDRVQNPTFWIPDVVLQHLRIV